MKTKFNYLTLFFVLYVFSSCGAEGAREPRANAHIATQTTEKNATKTTTQTAASAPRVLFPLDEVEKSAPARPPGQTQTLDELAELERAGSWVQGMALTESSLRESAGDYAGAVLAAFKELSLAYGRGLIHKTDVEQNLINVLTVINDDAAVSAVNAALAFLSEQWDEAAAALRLLFTDDEEPDSFARWMILTCALEKNNSEATDRRIISAYRSIRARYAQFPEYWYRGSRAFSGGISAEYAENCINTSPQGPFANECRAVIAFRAGLRAEDGLSIRTKREIESAIARSVNSGNPEVLDSLLPLIGLPDNPYTVFAVGALRALSNAQGYRDYFNRMAAASGGRLAERLYYISRGVNVNG